MTQFNTTQWTIVQRAADGTVRIRAAALNELLSGYIPALKSYLVNRKRLSHDIADDLIQGFLTKNVLEGELLQRADRKAGRFRSWLIRWLDNYTRHELSRKRKEVVSEECDMELSNPDHDRFDIEWARSTLKQAMTEMETECRRQDSQTRWVVFERRLLRPFLTDSEPVDYSELVADLHLQSTAQAQNLLVTAKRQFQRILESVVGRYCESEEEVTTELAEFRRILGTIGKLESDQQDQTRSTKSVSMDAAIAQARPDQIVSLLELEVTHAWQRCLNTPLKDLLSDPDITHQEFQSVDDLFADADPPRDLLIRLKLRGNQAVEEGSAQLPSETGLALYLIAIAWAYLKLGERITRSPESVLQSGYKWLSNDPFKDERTVALARAMLERIRSGW